MAIKTKLALFDLDGTLFDTRRANACAYIEILRPFGLIMDERYFADHCFGRSHREFLPEAFPDFPFTDEILKSIAMKKQALYPCYFNTIAENRPLFHIIEAILPTVNTAVVTSSARANTKAVLSFFGREALFHLLVTREDVGRPKPDPEGFLVAMKFFGTDPEDTMIFEDSDVGLAAARKVTKNIFQCHAFLDF